MPTSTKTFHTLAISDVHLRSENCQAELLLKTLKKYNYKVLLIVGDLIEDDHASSEKIKMNWHQFQLVEYLRTRVCNKDVGCKIIRITGNHDPTGIDFINQVLGIETQEDYRWEINGKKFCAIHGHQFDRFVSKNKFFSKLFSSLFFSIQKIDTRKRHLTRMMDRFHTKWFRLTEKIANGALELAFRDKLDVVICGHTHEKTFRSMSQGKQVVEYWNSGDWVSRECSFITIDDAGALELHSLKA